MKRCVIVVPSVCCVLISVTVGSAFVRESGPGGGVFAYWPNATTSLNLAVGCPRTLLSTFGPCWTDAVSDAATHWHHPTTAFHFTIQSPPTLTADPCGAPDDMHTLAFRATTCSGRGFGSALAITYFVLNPETGAFVDADIIFDANRPWTTYNGPLRTIVDGTPLYDFHRVAIHELGHFLGLDHPDDYGQSVVAIMDSAISHAVGSPTPQCDQLPPDETDRGLPETSTVSQPLPWQPPVVENAVALPLSDTQRAVLLGLCAPVRVTPDPTLSNIDTPQADDRAGVQAIYPVP